jgi:hypothetical protein
MTTDATTLRRFLLRECEPIRGPVKLLKRSLHGELDKLREDLLVEGKGDGHNLVVVCWMGHVVIS